MIMLRLLRRFMGLSVHPKMTAEASLEKALDTLSRQGIHANFYLPEAGCMNVELAAALRLLGDRGYLMTDSRGLLVGKVAKARLSADDRAKESRKRFFLIEQ